MFLGLGGSRRRGAQQSIASATSVEYKQQLQELSSLQPPLENPLQALATGKYATSSFQGDSSTLPCREPVIATSPSSPLSTYHLPASLSTMSSDSGISLPGSASEEAMSRETLRGRSQALDLAKKLKSSLGSKFADSLRETIKEVVMKHDSHNNAWSLEDCEVAKRPWEWAALEHHSPVPAKRLSWFSQEKLSQSAIAELSWGTGAIATTTSRPSSTMDTTSELLSSTSDFQSCFSTGPRASWTDHCSGTSRRSRHIFPEAAAMGTCSRMPESVQLQQSSCCSSSSNNPNSTTKKVDQSSSLLEFLTHGPLSATNRQQNVLNAVDSSESWHQHASTSYFGVPLTSQQELPGELSTESKGVKRPHGEDLDAFSSKRQLLLHHDDDDGVKSASSVIVGGFEEYLANLAATAARVPSSYEELPVSPLADLLEDLSHDSLVPIHLP